MARKSAIDMVVRAYTDPCSPYKTRTIEDELLCRYREWLADQGITGTIYSESPVKPTFKSNIPYASIEVKRVDAIYIPGPESLEIIRFKKSSRSFDNVLEREFYTNIEGQDFVGLTEIKKRLNYEAIGQVLVYEDLIKENYSVGEILKQIVCHQEDPDMLSTLEKYGIELLVM